MISCLSLSDLSGMVISSSIHVAGHYLILFYGWVTLHCIYMYHIFFIHSSVDGHLGCLHVLAIINSAAVNEKYCFVSLTLIYIYIFFCLFRATSVAYGASQARGQIRAAVASHSNAKSRPHMWPNHSSQQHWILNPLSKDRDQTFVLMDTVGLVNLWAMMGTPSLYILFFYLPLANK